MVRASSDGRTISLIKPFAADLGIPSQNTSSYESEEIDPHSVLDFDNRFLLESLLESDL